MPTEAAEAVLDRLAEVGLVDDGAYAKAWVESRHRGRGLGRRALAHELRTRGIADQERAEALDTLDPERELATAQALVARRLPALRGLDRPTRVRRLTGMLARKGYAPGVIARVVHEALAADALLDDDPYVTEDDLDHGTRPE